MVNVFLEMTKKVGIFMIISQTLLHLGIAGAYEKYIRLVISFMTAAQIIFSFAALFGTQNYSLFSFAQEEFQKEWQEEIDKFEENLKEKRQELFDHMEIRVQEQEEERKEMEGRGKIQIGKIRIE